MMRKILIALMFGPCFGAALEVSYDVYSQASETPYSLDNPLIVVQRLPDADNRCSVYAGVAGKMVLQNEKLPFVSLYENPKQCVWQGVSVKFSRVQLRDSRYDFKNPDPSLLSYGSVCINGYAVFNPTIRYYIDNTIEGGALAYAQMKMHDPKKKELEAHIMSMILGGAPFPVIPDQLGESSQVEQ